MELVKKKIFLNVFFLETPYFHYPGVWGLLRFILNKPDAMKRIKE